MDGKKDLKGALISNIVSIGQTQIPLLNQRVGQLEDKVGKIELDSVRDDTKYIRGYIDGLTRKFNANSG